MIRERIWRFDLATYSSAADKPGELAFKHWRFLSKNTTPHRDLGSCSNFCEVLIIFLSGGSNSNSIYELDFPGFCSGSGHELGCQACPV
jgi:hypothetical protein